MTSVEMPRSRRQRSLRAITVAGVAIAIAATSLLGASPARAADFTIDEWRTVEIPLTSTATYADPFADVEVTATFTGPNSETISRPAFWDGGSNWKVRFAPTSIGTWTMTTTASNALDAGLHGITKTIDSIAYTGSLEIYQRGFVKIDSGDRYLTYADDTPFFWLGDTHWVLPHERWDSSNAPGVDSEFKYVVDKRVDQGFTVYQSEPIWQPHGGSHTDPDEEDFADLTDGFSSSDLAGFHNLDRKYEYIADAGLVHAAALVTWAAQPAAYPVFTDAYMADLTRYWIARYGSYPAVWTIAQEIDQNLYGTFNSTTMSKWYSVGATLDSEDDYHHPIMPHQENSWTTNSSNSSWSSLSYHDGFAAQIQDINVWDRAVAEDYWDVSPIKPTIAYETAYEDFWTDSRHALSAGYKAFQLGMYGYGYGVSGVWNNVHSAPGDPLDAGTEYELPARYQWWFDGANKSTADQLTFMRDFYVAHDWFELEPRFDDASWATFTSGDAYLATAGNESYVVLFADGTTSTGTLKQLDDDYYYSARWFDPRTGTYSSVSNAIVPSGGEWSMPNKPNASDFLLVVKKGSEIATTAAPPEASPPGGQFEGFVEVTLTSATPGASIRYTTDGTDPTATSALYTAPITIAGPVDVPLKAKSFAAGLSPSPTITETYIADAGLTGGATFSASSAYDSNQGAAKAFDGERLTTNWQACLNCWSGEWLEADFGASTTFNTVTVSEYDARTSSYRIEYWTGSTWSTAYTGSGGFGSWDEPSVIHFPAVTGSKVRLLYLSGNSWSPIVYEMGVFNVLNANLASGKSYSSSSQWDSTQGPAKAFDGSSATNWQACSGCWSGEWLEVDFGAMTEFNTISVEEYDNRTQSYEVQYWNGSGWQTAHSGSGSFGTFGETKIVSFPAVTGSKARLYFLSGTSYAPVIYELGFHNQ